ncbi:MAG: hypothetical protein NTV54_06490 [Ignavibacteriales bacterium]|nr:hypothetical protein [Ignavibacteriales bacterium]
MSISEALITRAAEICSQINLLSALMDAQQKEQHRLVISFDVYCTLLDYTAYKNPALETEEDVIVAEQMIIVNDFLFETPRHNLEVKVDFFALPGVIDIE